MIVLSKTGPRAGRSDGSKEPSAMRLIPISNRHIPELETHVTCGKQTTAPRSNRHFFGGPSFEIHPACPDVASANPAKAIAANLQTQYYPPRRNQTT